MPASLPVLHSIGATDGKREVTVRVARWRTAVGRHHLPLRIVSPVAPHADRSHQRLAAAEILLLSPFRSRLPISVVRAKGWRGHVVWFVQEGHSPQQGCD